MTIPLNTYSEKKIIYTSLMPIFFILFTAGSKGRVVLGRACLGLTGGFLLLRNFSVAISVSPQVCFILVLILISMFLR